MENNPLVSIICTCYNHAAFVVECLDSVIGQDYKNIELIIVDDCSSDDSVVKITEWLKNHPQALFIKNTVNLGITKSFNNAIKIAKGEYIIDLAADDILLKDCIVKQLNKFATSEFENLAIVYGNVALVNECGDFIENYFEVNLEGKTIKPRKSGNEYIQIITGGKDALCPVASMIKKEVFDNLNGYDETLVYEDLDFWIRAARIYNFDFIDNVIFKKRVLSNSLGSDFYRKKSSLSERINTSTYKIIKKVLVLNQSKEEDFAVLKRIHYNMVLNFKNVHFSLVLKYLYLEFKIRFKLLLSHHKENRLLS